MSSSPDLTPELAQAAGIGVSRVRAHLLDWPVVERDWKALAPCFAAAASATWARYTPEDLAAMTKTGELLFFAIVEEGQPPRVLACVWAQRVQLGRKVVGELCFAGAHPAAGPMQPGGWSDAFKQMASVLADAGCEQVQITGRPGWGPVLGLKPAAAHFVVNVKARVTHG